MPGVRALTAREEVLPERRARRLNEWCSRSESSVPARPRTTSIRRAGASTRSRASPVVPRTTTPTRARRAASGSGAVPASSGSSVKSPATSCARCSKGSTRVPASRCGTPTARFASPPSISASRRRRASASCSRSARPAWFARRTTAPSARRSPISSAPRRASGAAAEEPWCSTRTGSPPRRSAIAPHGPAIRSFTRTSSSPTSPEVVTSSGRRSTGDGSTLTLGPRA